MLFYCRNDIIVNLSSFLPVTGYYNGEKFIDLFTSFFFVNFVFVIFHFFFTFCFEKLLCKN
jgi:hypothetical protein